MPMDLMDFLRELGMPDDVKYNFNAKLKEFEAKYPDVSVYRQHETKPCPYHFMYEDGEGKRYAQFYYSYSTARTRWEGLKNWKYGSLTVFGLDYISVGSGIYYPVKRKD